MSSSLLIRLFASTLCVIVPTMMAAQSQTSPPRPARDSAFATRSVSQGDTAKKPWSAIGRISADASEGTTVVRKEDLRRVQYQQLADAVIRTTPWNQLSHGGFGQHDGISVLGGRNTDLSVGINGRSLREQWSGMYQLVQAQPASIDRIELVMGTDAVGRASSMSLSELNLTTITHNTATPFTSLWYHQGGGNLVAVDGTISQNVADGLNVTLGVRRSGAEGGYPRTGFDIWNVRAAVRWTISPQTHALVTYQLASLNTNLWGGLTQGSMPTSVPDIATTPLYDQLRDETRRHDVSVHLAHMFDRDSASILRTTAYLSSSSLLRLRDSTLFVGATDSLVGLGMSGQTIGLQVRYDQRISDVRLHLGASIDAQQLDARIYAQSFSDAVPQLFGHVTVPVASWLDLRAAARLQIEQGSVRTGGGFAAEMRLDNVRVLADISTITRSASASEGRALNPERHLLAMLRASSESAPIRWSVTAFARRIADPIRTRALLRVDERILSTTSYQETSRSVLGLVGSATWRLGPIEFVPTIRIQSASGDSATEASDVPACMADLAVGYVFDAGFSTVTLGLRSAIVTGHWAPQFVPLTWTYVRAQSEAPLQYDGLNLFLSARVGNATVRASYENILGQRWYTTSLAPEVTRALRLSVDWSFLD